MKINSIIFPLLSVPTAFFLQLGTASGGLEDTIIKFIATIGFPAAIAIYVLVRLEGAMQKLEESMDRNTRVLAVILSKLGCDETIKELVMSKKNGKNGGGIA